MKRNVVMMLALLFVLINTSFTTVYAQVKVQVEVVKEVSPFEKDLAEADKMYDQKNERPNSRFEDSSIKTDALLVLLDKIRLDGKFKKLETVQQAELLHRTAYVYEVSAMQTLNQMRQIKVSFEELVDQFKKLDTSANLAKNSLVLSQKIGINYQRQVKLISDDSYQLCFFAILLNALSWNEKVICNTYKEAGLAHMKWLVENTTAGSEQLILPGTRYISKGLFIFKTEDKEKALKGIIGVAKYTKDIPKTMSEKDAISIIGAVEYTTEDIASWINNSKSFTDAEIAFAKALRKLELIKFDGSNYYAGSVKTIMILRLESTEFSHEFAHTVQKHNEDLLGIARFIFASRTTEEDQKLFKDLMHGQNPDMSETDMLEEFFAYTFQIDDWRILARKIVADDKAEQQKKKRRK